MPDRRLPCWSALVVLAVCGLASTPASAEVAVLSNRTPARLTISILPDGGPPQPFTMEVGESRPVFYQRALSVRFGEGLVERTYQIAAKSAYFFTRGLGDEPLRMEQIGFSHNKPAPSEPTDARFGASAPVVSVKILVDDNEPTHRQIWEANLRRRFAAAADVIERHSGVKLQITAIGTWDSDDRQRDFTATLTEFEREVSPAPAQLAIGFTSQYNAQLGRVHMGGTRGALHPYILLKERSPTMLETERIELLVHELGHYLGASHSPEPQSVMRPLLTNDVQRRAGARIGFDPVNTLLVAMVGDELRNRGVKRLHQVSQPTRTRMEEIYGVLTKALPDDSAAGKYLQLLSLPAAPPAAQPAPQQAAQAPAPATVPVEATTVAETSRLLSQLLRVVNARRPENADGAKTQWYSGDALTEFYVRQAALAALQLEPKEMEKVFLLALGVFLDDSNTLQEFPATAPLISRMEQQAQRDKRLSVLGSPTMRDRRDLAQHFFVSAHLTALVGPQLALGIGLGKEMQDADRGTGFSFADLAADRAGVEFARRVAAGEISMEDLSQGFAVADYLPPVDYLPEGLSLEDLKTRYGDASSEAFQQEVKQMETAILNLPVYNRGDQE